LLNWKVAQAVAHVRQVVVVVGIHVWVGSHLGQLDKVAHVWLLHLPTNQLIGQEAPNQPTNQPTNQFFKN
jgi:hypothetical protein